MHASVTELDRIPNLPFIYSACHPLFLQVVDVLMVVEGLMPLEDKEEEDD